MLQRREPKPAPRTTQPYSLGTVRVKTMVEDDFQLICFDMVSDPSTPGAFMMTEAKVPSNIFTKEDKIFRSLNNFLYKFGEK